MCSALKTAVHFGADAVYIGGEAYGLRANARNFSMEDMKAGIHYAHQHGVSVHVTVNVLAHSPELPGIEQYLKELAALGEDAPDALIIADPGVFLMAKRLCPMCELHVSTQANSLNYADFPTDSDILPPGNLHEYDYQFFYRNLQENVRVRTEQFLSSGR